MVKFGPLHDNRRAIVRKLADLPLKTGDILYRASDARGPLGLPFTSLVARATKSLYSHAALVLVEANEMYVMEINDAGTLKLRLIDWLDGCATPEFSLYRLKIQKGLINTPIEKKIRTEIYQELLKVGLIGDDLGKEIEGTLEEDADYDFTFSDNKKFYCTEAVVKIYEKAGIKLCEPSYIRDILHGWRYNLFAAINWLSGLAFNVSMPLNEPLYFVGNEQKGLMSSQFTELILHYKQ
jgi:hypothetical protein